MKQLLFGLVLFFGMHSISIVALPLRDRLAANRPIAWKLIYSVVSLAGIILMVRGYADTRQTSAILYVSAGWLREVALILLMPAFVLFFAPYFPGRIKSSLHHPQLIAVILWAAVHLAVNGRSADVLLFGVFLVWAVAGWVSMRSRESRKVPGAPESRINDFVVIVVGLAVYTATLFWLHEMLTGSRLLA